jgi:hypothetical protein
MSEKPTQLSELCLAILRGVLPLHLAVEWSPEILRERWDLGTTVEQLFVRSRVRHPGMVVLALDLAIKIADRLNDRLGSAQATAYIAEAIAVWEGRSPPETLERIDQSIKRFSEWSLDSSERTYVERRAAATRWNQLGYALTAVRWQMANRHDLAANAAARAVGVIYTEASNRDDDLKREIEVRIRAMGPPTLVDVLAETQRQP